jgi:hypothetical protein
MSGKDQVDSRVPIEVSVSADDELLRQAIDSLLRISLQSKDCVRVASDAGVWRMEVMAGWTQESDSHTEKKVTMSLRVVDGGLGHHELTDKHGHKVDSILGGALTCEVSRLSSTCADIVADVNKFAQLDRQASQGGR